MRRIFLIFIFQSLFGNIIFSSVISFNLIESIITNLSINNLRSIKKQTKSVQFFGANLLVLLLACLGCKNIKDLLE